MYCNYCHNWFAYGTSHWCNAANGCIYFPFVQSSERKSPIEEKLDKIIELLEKKKK